MREILDQIQTAKLRASLARRDAILRNDMEAADRLDGVWCGLRAAQMMIEDYLRAADIGPEALRAYLEARR